MKKCMLMFGLLLLALIIASITSKSKNEILKDRVVLEARNTNDLLTNRENN